jgi:U6 snRNA-associated Sm-like protein LSm1
MSYSATRKSTLEYFDRTTSLVSSIHLPLTCIQLTTKPANLVLTECYERIAARNPDATSSSDSTTPRWLIHDVKLPGVMTIRGENVTICATVDLDREDAPRGATFADEDQVRTLAASQKAAKKDVDSRKAKALKQAGIEPGFGMQTA